MTNLKAAQSYWQEIEPEIQHFDLAIVIPAFNEEKRIVPTLLKLQEYFSSSNFNYQVIVVDDGSTDRTSETVINLSSQINNLEVVTLQPNVGKGWAVRSGVLASRAKLILFCDADGATPFSEFEKLYQEINAGAKIAIGSRAIPHATEQLKTNFLRKTLGRTFNFLVNLLILPKYYDTQCGFKLFQAPAGQIIFYLLSRKGFSFDLEVLFLAKKLGFTVKEVAVNWTNIAGSKVNIVQDSTKMFIDIFKIRLYWRQR